MSVLGVATVKKAERKAEIPFAMIPLLFGVQQIIEGVLWLSFRFDAPLLNVIMTYVFTLFSHVLWPIFVPFSIGLMETVAWRKKVISAFQITGIAVGLYHLYVIVKFPVTSEFNGHIVYVSPYFNKVPVLVLYLAATCVGAFFSSHKIINIFGALALLLFMVAYWFYTVAFFSVWCFFAAILSVVIYLHFKFGNERAPYLMHHRA
ncbi:MAG: hypothetical protein Q7J80_07975 [Anaerolineales bacterium]|nr:hypothetical protein [Anaerolineales bacterium]